MKIFHDPKCADYAHPGHPERPERITRTAQRLRSQTELKLEWVSPSPVEDAVLLRAHSPEHLARLKENADFDMDTPAYEGIATFARASVGASLGAMQAARKGEVAFSLMRPPGHHATRSRAMGFCYLSNVAIAMLEAMKDGVEKVAVYDFDVHHGNGTEAILLNKPGAVFHSIHQHPCYPGTGTRNVGNNCLNYPLPPQTPRKEYVDVLDSALRNIGKFKPDLLGISAGFDCFARDPLAQERLESEDFNWLGQTVRKLGIPTFCVLEGGYSEELPELIFAFLKGLEGK